MKMLHKNLTITIYEGKTYDPLVLMHEDHGEGERIKELLSRFEASCTLVCISNMSWEHDLSPWEAPASFKRGEPFTGGANKHLKVITEELIPEIEKRLDRTFSEIYIAGYSLAGLFAMYSVYNTDIFSGFVSASGSLWFPDFTAYAKKEKLSERVKKAYFSLGDKEAKTKNQTMQSVEKNTRILEGHLAQQGIETCFELNEGGHFKDDDLRLAKGIRWILQGGAGND